MLLRHLPGTKDLDALSLTSRTLLDVVRGDALLRPKYRLLGRLSQAAARLFRNIDLANHLIAQAYGPILGLLEPKQRDSLVAPAISIDEEFNRASAIAGLGAGVAHLSEPQRDSLVAAAIGIKYDFNKGRAIAGLGAGVAYLSEPQRDSLVAAAIGSVLDCPRASRC